jgi:hypothetical protein
VSVTADFEVGAQDATVAVTDAGSANAWDAVSIGANTTVKYDGLAHTGKRSVRFVSAGAGGAYTSTISWSSGTLGTTTTDHWGRFYLYLTKGLNGDRVFQARTTAGAQGASISIFTDQTLRLLDSALAVVATGTKAFPVGKWSRIEYHIVHSATVGSIDVYTYLGDNAENPSIDFPDEHLSATNINSATVLNQLHYGLGDNDANMDFRIDDIVGQETGFVGPTSPDPTRVAAVGGLHDRRFGPF